MEIENAGPDFSQRIKSLRGQLGQTQRAFAKRCGISQSLVGQWEGAGAKQPGREAIDKVVAATGVSRDWLLDREMTDIATLKIVLPDEIDLVMRYRRLPSVGKENVLKVFDMILNSAGVKKKKGSPAEVD